MIKNTYFPKLIIAMCAGISFLAYIWCPIRYSFTICVIAMILFILDFVSFLMQEKIENYFCFSVIFSVVFFFVYYFYPVFVYPISKAVASLPIFYNSFNESIITKSTLLATVGYSAFVIGMLCRPKKDGNAILESNQILISNSVPTAMAGIVSALLAVQIFILNMGIYSGKGSSSPVADAGFWGYFYIIGYAVIHSAVAIEFYILINRKRKIAWYSRNPVLWIFIACYILTVLYSGNRADIISLALIVVYGVLLSSDKKWSIWKTALYASIGMMIMYLLLVRRQHWTATFSIENIASDLIINNFTLYKGYDYVFQNGIEPFTLFGSLLSAVPFLQGAVVEIFGIDIYLTSSARFLSFLTLGNNPSYGVGTNIIISLYMGLGLFGVVIFMFILGKIANKYSKCSKSSSPIKLLLCFELISYSVYLVRADYFFPVGRVLWSLVFTYFMCLISSKKL